MTPRDSEGRPAAHGPAPKSLNHNTNNKQDTANASTRAIYKRCDTRSCQWRSSSPTARCPLHHGDTGTNEAAAEMRRRPHAGDRLDQRCPVVVVEDGVGGVTYRLCATRSEAKRVQADAMLFGYTARIVTLRRNVQVLDGKSGRWVPINGGPSVYGGAA